MPLFHFRTQLSPAIHGCPQPTVRQLDKDLVGRCSNRPRHRGIFDIPQHHTNCEGHFHTGEEAKPTENHKNTLFYDNVKPYEINRRHQCLNHGLPWRTQQEDMDGTENNGDSTVTLLPPKNRWGCATKNLWWQRGVIPRTKMPSKTEEDETTQTNT